MNRLFSRSFCAVFFAFGTPVLADIPMVTTPVIRSQVLVFPTFPQHGAQEFNGVTSVSAQTDLDIRELVDVASQMNVSAFGTPCEMDVRITSRPSAMIDLEVYAPCKPNAAVHVSHGGFSYEAKVSMTGWADLTFPAMHQKAEVFVAVADDVFERHVEIKDVEHFARITLVGVTGEDAQLVATSLSKPMEIYENRGVQIFSVDMREVNAAMTYRLTLRHHVTAQNCNQPVQTHLRRIMPGLSEQAQVLQFAPQDCSRIGDILELKNIVPDLKLASN